MSGLHGHHRVTTDVRDDLYEHVRRALDHYGVSISSYVRRALRLALEHDGFIKPRPTPKAVEHHEQRPSA